MLVSEVEPSNSILFFIGKFFFLMTNYVRYGYEVIKLQISVFDTAAFKISGFLREFRCPLVKRYKWFVKHIST